MASGLRRAAESNDPRQRLIVAGEGNTAYVAAFARTTFGLIRDTWWAFVDDSLSRHAAIAYFAVFAIAPLLVVVTENVALVLGRTDSAQLERVLQPLQSTLGPKAVNE